jgi:ubiquinone biosynthesis protein COQ4
MMMISRNFTKSISVKLTNRQLHTGCYYDRYKLSPIQRSFLFAYFGLSGFIDPNKGDMIAGIGDISSQYFLRNLYNKLLQDEQGRKLLQNKPLISNNTLDFTNLKSFPQNTLGYHYYHYMSKHRFNADERSIVRFTEDPELSYVLVRYRQIHDFWHVLSNLPPSVFAEVVLKCVEYQITGLPVCAFSGTVGQLRFSLKEIKQFYTIYLPWINQFPPKEIQNYSSLLLSFSYEENLHRDIDELRQILHFPPAPLIVEF